MIIFFWLGVVSPPFKLEDGEPPLVGCLQVLIQYIRSYSPHLEAITSTRTRHAVVTRDPVNMELYNFHLKSYICLS
jgi:hypothetical protein